MSNRLKIVDNWLVGDHVSKDHISSKNKTKFGANSPDTLIVHYTAGSSAQSSASYLASDNTAASAHIVIGRQGTIYQLAPFDIKTSHAGKSSYGGRTWLNKYSIGIELDNAGFLKKVGDQYQAWFGTFYPQSEVVLASHRNETISRYWHTFTDIQIELCETICQLLVDEYSIKSILGHEEISPGRKQDPGPAFPLDQLRLRIFSDPLDSEDTFVAGKTGTVVPNLLNIREQASIAGTMVANPLTKGKKVTILEEHNGWYKVKTEIEGWVSKGYIHQDEA